jgi:hypothetical protein
MTQATVMSFGIGAGIIIIMTVGMKGRETELTQIMKILIDPHPLVVLTCTFADSLASVDIFKMHRQRVDESSDWIIYPLCIGRTQSYAQRHSDAHVESRQSRTAFVISARQFLLVIEFTLEAWNVQYRD